MQTLVLLIILFLVSIFASLLYFKNKSSRVNELKEGTCPLCKAKAKTFYDEESKTYFTKEVIKARVLKTNSCSGVNEIEYQCKNCGLKEVYPNSTNSFCSMN